MTEEKKYTLQELTQQLKERENWTFEDWENHRRAENKKTTIFYKAVKDAKGMNIVRVTRNNIPLRGLICSDFISSSGKMVDALCEYEAGLYGTDKAFGLIHPSRINSFGEFKEVIEIKERIRRSNK